MVAWAKFVPRKRDMRQSKTSLRMGLPRQSADDSGTSMENGQVDASPKREVRQVPAGSLEEFCGRAALLAGAVKSHAGAGLGLELDGGVADDLCEDQRC